MVTAERTESAGATAVGSLAGPERLLVDRRGLLTPGGAGWSIDWWLGGDDRWHLPATGDGVRQSLVDDAPVVATAVRVPGGDVTATVAAFAGGAGTRVVVEVVNDTPAPVALALHVRPREPDGRVHEVELDGAVLRVDGVPALVLPERPSRALLVVGDDGDPWPVVTAGGAPPALDGLRRCPGGRAAAVVMVPLSHRSTYRWQLPLSEALATRRRRQPLRRQGGGVAEVVAPRAAAVARGWTSQVERLVRLDLPGSPVTAAVPAVRAHLLLASGATPVGPDVAAAAATAGYGTTDPAPLLHTRHADLAAAGLWAAGRLVSLGAGRPSAGEVAGAAELVARAASRGPVQRAGAALAAASALLATMGEEAAAAQARAWAVGVASQAAGGEGAAEVALRALALAEAGGPGWLEQLAALVAGAGPTVAWADPVVGARYWSAVRAALLGDGPASLDLVPGWAPSWDGAPVEVHQMPSAAGLASLAVRWHGARPALLWSVDGAPADLVVRAPALDPTWSGRGPTGEALLAGAPRRDG